MVFSALFLLYLQASPELHLPLYVYDKMLCAMLNNLQHFWIQCKDMLGSLPPHGTLGSVVGTATRYGLTVRISNPGGANFSAPVQTGSEFHSTSYTMCTGSFPGIKRPERGLYHSPPCSAEVKERVGVCLYSPSGPSWLVLG
jgi:hypothetical protein